MKVSKTLPKASQNVVNTAGGQDVLPCAERATFCNPGASTALHELTRWRNLRWSPRCARVLRALRALIILAPESEPINTHIQKQSQYAHDVVVVLEVVRDRSLGHLMTIGAM